MMRMRTKVALVAGAAIMWFADPQQGRRRRAMATSKVRSLRRRSQESAERAARYDAGVAAGEQARAEGGGEYHAHSYVDLREHLRGELHRMGLHDVNVDVDEDQRVTLRGQVDDEAHEQVIALASTTAGVADVVDLTHRPGEVAPNKAAAIAASRDLQHSDSTVIHE